MHLMRCWTDGVHLAAEEMRKGRAKTYSADLQWFGCVVLPTYRRHGHERPTNGDNGGLMARGSVQEGAVSSLRSRAILMPKAVTARDEAHGQAERDTI